MGRISQVVQQNLDASIWKRFPDEAHQPHVVLKILICVISDCLAVVFLEQLRVNLLLGRFELRPHIILLADKNELSRGRMIFVLQKVMHPEPEIFQAEFAEVFASDCKWIEIVLFQVPTEFASPFLVFPPEKTRRQKEPRHNDGCDYIDTKL